MSSSVLSGLKHKAIPICFRSYKTRAAVRVFFLNSLKNIRSYEFIGVVILKISLRAVTHKNKQKIYQERR